MPIFEVEGVKYKAKTDRAARLQRIRLFLPLTTDATLDANVHWLYNQHYRKPPHLQDETDKIVTCMLLSIVDPAAYHTLNPVEEVAIGQIVEIDDYIRFHWYMCARVPLIDKNEPKFDGFKARDWVYASYRYHGGEIGSYCYTDGYEWLSAQKIDDPTDPEVIKRAWDSIPRKVCSDPDAWPLRQDI